MGEITPAGDAGLGRITQWLMRMNAASARLMRLNFPQGEVPRFPAQYGRLNCAIPGASIVHVVTPECI